MEIEEEVKENIFDKPKESFIERTNEKELQTSTTQHFEEQTDLFIIVPPDGGWGWMVVIAAFYSFLISDGIIYTFGIFLFSISQSFDCSTSKAALTGAIMTGFFCLTGPFIAALINQFGCRKIAVFGSLIASLSCVLTSVSPSLYLTFLTHGIMGGLGFGMIYVPAVIAVGFYFERWRALATGIAVCGAGIGGIALPPLLIIILNEGGWRYTFQIMAILSFSCAFFGLLYKPLKPVKIDSVTFQDKNNDKSSFFDRFHNISHPTVSDLLSKSKSSDIQTECTFLPSPVQSIKGDVHVQLHPSTTTSYLKNIDIHTKLYSTSSNFQAISTVTIFRPQKLPRNISSEFIMSGTGSPTSFKSGKMSKRESSIENFLYSTKNVDSKLSTVYEEGKKTDKCCRKCINRLSCKRCCDINKYCKKTKCTCCKVGETTNRNNIVRPLYRDDIFYSASLMFLPEYRKSMYVTQSKATTSAPTSILKSKSSLEYNMLVTRTITQRELNEAGTCALCSESIKRTLATMLDFSVLKSPSFLLLIFNAIFTSLGFYTPYMFIKDRAVQHGVPKNLAFWLISGIGVTNTLGRIVCGVVSSFPNVQALHLSYISLFIGGMATLLSGLSYNIWIQFTYAALYGIAVACMSALRTIIIVELLGLQKLTNAIGIILMFQGVASLIGTSISGFLRDLTGDYQTSFYFAGGCMSIGSVLLVPIKKVSVWEKQRQEELRILNSKYSEVQTA